MDSVIGYYVDADSLFDTRLGTVSLLDPKVAAALVKDPDYYTRIKDDFCKRTTVRTKDYDTAYSNRNVATLQNSIRTRIVDHIYDIFSDQFETLTSRFATAQTVLYVNLYPYTLGKEEQTEFEIALKELFPIFHKVELLFKPLTEISPAWIKQRGIVVAYQYDLNGWFAAHHVALEHTLLTQSYLMFPELLNWFNEASLTDQGKELARVLSAFRAFELAFQHKASFRLIPVEYYCIDRA